MVSVRRIPEADLSGKQRSHLRAMAHHLTALVRIGQSGIDSGVEDAVADALDTHELIKVKLLETAPLSRSEAAEQLSASCGAHVVGQIGKIVILYRRHPVKPAISLPRQ